MPATYEPIASQTLGSDAAFIEFTSIPGTYTDLRLIFTGRSALTSTISDAFSLTVNGNTANNYSDTYIYGDGTTAASARNSSQPAAYGVRLATSSGSNTDPIVCAIDFMSYSNANVFKTILSASASTREAFGVVRCVSLWRSTSAITSIKLTPFSATNIKSGATASLYGIKAA